MSGQRAVPGVDAGSRGTAVVRTLSALADPGPLARLVDRAEHGARTEPLGIVLLGAVPLAAVLVLLDADLFDRLVFTAAVVVFVLATVVGCAGRLAVPLGWLLPAVLAAAEYTVVIRVTATLAPDATPAAYAFCAVVAYHLYDTVYRARHLDSPPPAWLFVAGGGHDVRLLAFAVLALVGPSMMATGLWALTALLAVVYLTESVRAWVTWARHAKGAVGSLEREDLT